MGLLRTLAVTTLIILTGGFLNLSEAAGFNFKAGIGYDFLSQEYFLDSIAEAGPDSIFAEFSLTTDYLDDVKGLFAVNWSPFEDRRFELTTQYEQTPEFIRLKFLGDLRTKVGRSKLDIFSELDWRHKSDDSASFGDSYLLGYSRAKLAVPLSKKIKSTWQLRAEFVDFDSVTTFSYDFYRLGGKIGLEMILGNISFGDARITVDSRQVPDSSALNYLNFGVEGSFFGFYRQGEIDFFSRFEKKDYNRSDNNDDFIRYEFTGRHKLRLGRLYYLRQELDFEYVGFDPSDPVNHDYFQLGLTFLTGLEGFDYSIGLGPDFELLSQSADDDLLLTEDYFEAGVKLDFDLMKIRRYFASLESVTGYRNLKNENDLLTDFSYERLNLIGDLNLLGGLNLNLLFSAEWEWHEISTNNSTLFLLSSNLSYSF